MWGTLAARECWRREVYHGDIKLEKLLINFQNLEVKLIDSGKARRRLDLDRIPDHPKPLPKDVTLTILANIGPVMDIMKLLDWQDQQGFYIMVIQCFSHMDVFHFVKRKLRQH
ncbi:Serine/threonine-protein kinase pim-3 [Labeo rohita]|uniref:non-specific serine/threonine protein kinase n=1 Tax=Labeo rohita TaxID=84645 RepID=A0ABQ8LZI3_LABRO|nr:Serine/threonine-protein kinase pim-3 [Labeo rohita]